MELGWVDFSREDRRKITSIIKMMGDGGTIDELGIGTIRDGFSEKLFPGSSTVQTRAKYFILIPQVFALAEEQHFGRKSDVLAWIHKKEDELVTVLRENGAKHGDGVIGLLNEGRKRGNARKPSDIYWNGLKTFSILLPENAEYSFSDVCDIVYDNSKRRELELKTEDKETGADDIDYCNNREVIFDPIKGGFKCSLDKANINLSRREADYLYRKITQSDSHVVRESLTCHLLKHPEQIALTFGEIDINRLPTHLREITHQAQEYAEFVSGAHILFNVVYSEENGKRMDEDKMDDFRKWRRKWKSKSLEVDAIAHFTNAKTDAIAFIRSFDRFVKVGDIGGAKKLVRDRERAIKPGRAKINGEKPYEPINDSIIQYRYRTVKRILEDIKDGLN